MSSSKDLKGLLNEDDFDDELNLDIESLGLKIGDILENLPIQTTTLPIGDNSTTTTTTTTSTSTDIEDNTTLKRMGMENDISSSEEEDDDDDDDDDSSNSEDDDYEDSSVAEEEDDQDEELLSKETLMKSVNIALPISKPKQLQESFLSKKKTVNVKDRFDYDNFQGGSIKKHTAKKAANKKKSTFQMEIEAAQNEPDTDDEDDGNSNSSNIVSIVTGTGTGTDDNNKDKDGDDNMKDINNEENTTTTTTTTTSKSQKSQKSKKSKKEDREVRINKDVRALISKGNEQYSKGLFSDAFATFAEVVRMSPRLTVPYNILGKIKEQQGEHKEALGFYIYGAQMQATNSELWSSIGYKAKDLGQPDTALYCFTRAFRNDKTDLDSLWERGLILVEKGFHKRALKGLVKLNKIRPDDPQVLQELARVYSNLSQYHDASKLISQVVDESFLTSKPLEEISLDSVNLMMELKNKTRNYQDTIQIFNKIVAKFGNESDVPIDLVFNACQAYFSLGTENGNERGSRLLNSRLLPLDPHELGDLFFSLGEELFLLGKFNEALIVLLRLKDTTFDTPSAWVKIADCFRIQKNYPQAIRYFEMANERLPGNVNTTLAMSEIYKEMGDDEKALQILNQSSTLSNKNEQSEKEIFESTLKDLEAKRVQGIRKDDVKLVYRHAQAYLNLSKYSLYLGIATALLNGSSDKFIYNRKVGVGVYKKKKRYKKTRTIYALEMQKHQTSHPFAEILDEEDYFNLLLDTSKVLSHLNRQQEASQYLRYALRNIRFENNIYSHQLKFLTVAVAFNDKNYYLAYKHVKYVCSKKPYSNRVWNLLNKILVKYGTRSSSQSRFLYKLNEKYPDSVPVLIMLGNLSKQTDNARGALFDYLRAYKINPNDPLVNLLIAVLILSQVMGRKQLNRHRLTITAFSFLFKYFNLRGSCQESFYNLGRGFHQLGIYNMAIDYYNKVLDYQEESNDDGEIDKNQSLKCEAAFNLSLIYKSKGNINLANDILKKYIVI